MTHHIIDKPLCDTVLSTAAQQLCLPTQTPLPPGPPTPSTCLLPFSLHCRPDQRLSSSGCPPPTVHSTRVARALTIPHHHTCSSTAQQAHILPNAFRPALEFNTNSIIATATSPHPSPALASLSPDYPSPLDKILNIKMEPNLLPMTSSMTRANNLMCPFLKMLKYAPYGFKDYTLGQITDSLTEDCHLQAICAMTLHAHNDWTYQFIRMRHELINYHSWQGHQFWSLPGERHSNLVLSEQQAPSVFH